MTIERSRPRAERLANTCRQPADRAVPAAILALGALLFWLSRNHAGSLPAWAPWDFSAPIYLAIAFPLFWFLRGLARTPAPARPPVWRRILFLLGVAAIYAVLQTRFEYWSQHMFFLNRIQHVVMHHLGPFLIALGSAGATIKAGMPERLRRWTESRPVRVPLRVLQQPVLAAFLFVGSFFFWLIPGVHFRAMIDPRLYALMNWTMVLDGILFWCLVLDVRPKPPARTAFAVRGALAIGVMFPQILLGAALTFCMRDLYPYYDQCGRILPSISALTDQHIGGIMIWIPPGMMSVIAALLVLITFGMHEESRERTKHDPSVRSMRAAGYGTGR